MELSRTVASLAVVLGVILAAGHALGDAAGGATDPKPTVQQRLDEREAQRRAAMEEHQRRKQEFARACNKTLNTEAEMQACRAAYRRLQAGKL